MNDGGQALQPRYGAYEVRRVREVTRSRQVGTRLASVLAVRSHCVTWCTDSSGRGSVVVRHLADCSGSIGKTLGREDHLRA